MINSRVKLSVSLKAKSVSAYSNKKFLKTGEIDIHFGM